MAFAPGTRVGPYEVLAKLGEGGMGEVYRAKDVNLGRDVALKVLPDAFAQDADRLARFEREAKTLASLNHPNIATIHGFEKSEGVRALVMELVEGPTVADRIARGAIPIDEALPIAKQIAEALEAAHEQGIVHRDLKPANVKVRDDGTVKVLDFGLAKMLDGGPPEGGPYVADVGAGFSRPTATMSPTITTPAMTQLGMILGTAAYMAPEQARGKPVDKRSDIWAFGCVLFEMLTGGRAFEGEDTTDTIAAVVRAEPKWDALPADVPQSIRLLLKRCLEKDRKKRIGDVSTALFIMNESALVSAPAIAAPAVDTARSKWRYVAWSAVAVVIASATAAGSVWIATRPDPPRVSRFELPTAGASALALFANQPHLTITPDGSKVIYLGGTQRAGTTLFVRSLDRLEAVRLTDRAAQPFVSPDSEWVGFFSPDGLRKVAVTGGPSIEIAKIDGGPRGAAWGADDSIIFGTSRVGSGLWRVAAAGGTPVALTQPEKGTHYVRPSLLPGGRGVLFSVQSEAADVRSIAVLDLRSSGAKPKILVPGGSDARYLPTGHLIYLADNSLRAVRFDLDRLEVRGSAVPVLAAVGTIGTGFAGDFDVAADGTLVYLPPNEARSAARSLTWVDRGGKEALITAPPKAYLYPRLSPDGTRVAVDVSDDQDRDIWVLDLVRGNSTRVTKDASPDRAPLWAADGESLFFSSSREGTPVIYRQRADGTGAAERLTRSSVAQFPLALSPDGSLLLFHEGPGGAQGADVMALSLDGKLSVRALVKTPNGEENGSISPDGRWLAYQSNESGNWDIYVRPMRDLEHGARATVSTAGGIQPRWSRDGRELFYVSPLNEMMGSAVGSGDTWSSQVPVKLFDTSPYFIGGDPSPFFNYDVGKDGRFLMLKPMGGTTGETSTTANIVVVQNWLEEVKRLLPR